MHKIWWSLGFLLEPAMHSGVQKFSLFSASAWSRLTFCPILLSHQFPPSHFSLIFFFFFFFSLISFSIFDQKPHFIPPNKQQFPSPSKSFFTTSYLSSHPFLPSSLHQLPLPSSTPNSSSQFTLSLCHPSPSSAFSFSVYTVWFFSFLGANAWQRRSCWLYVFIVIKLGQSPFSGTKSKWHSLAHVHTSKLSSSHNSMALSFLPTGNSPWQMLLSEPCPDMVSESTP